MLSSTFTVLWSSGGPKHFRFCGLYAGVVNNYNMGRIHYEEWCVKGYGISEGGGREILAEQDNQGWLHGGGGI